MPFLLNIGNKQTPGENNEVNRQNAFGFMRLVFAAMVVYSHAWFLAGPELEPYASWLFNGADTPGGIGVKCFFILSGFLVIRSECRSRSTRGFLWKRGLRIYPGLWGCLVMTGLVFPWLAEYVLKIGNIDGGNAWSYVWHNAVHPRQQLGITGMFSQIHYPGELNGSLWTLPYELGCYAIVGLVGWLGLTQGKARGTWFVGGGLLLLYFTDIIRGDEALYFKQGNRMIIGYFALGSLVGLLSDLKLRKLFSPLLVGGLMLAWVVSW